MATGVVVWGDEDIGSLQLLPRSRQMNSSDSVLCRHVLEICQPNLDADRVPHIKCSDAADESSSSGSSIYLLWLPRRLYGKHIWNLLAGAHYSRCGHKYTITCEALILPIRYPGYKCTGTVSALDASVVFTGYRRHNLP